jgi:hypothetical protein
MSFALTSTFFQNARGLTFEDTASITWSFNKNTNQISAAGAGTVSSVALADDSTTPIYAIGGSPVDGSGTLTLTLETQAKNLVFAGPTTGSNAQPAFRALVVADIPANYPYSSLSGVPSIPSGANPSASVGLTANNGSATTYMRSDGSPALSVSITPTWTGLHTWDVTTSTYALKWGDGTRIGGLFVGSASIQIGTVSNTPLQFFVNSGGASLTINANGSIVCAGEFAINNVTPPSQVTGFGTPTGAAVVANFSGTAATTTQMQETIAQILTILKAYGMIGA